MTRHARTMEHSSSNMATLFVLSHFRPYAVDDKYGMRSLFYVSNTARASATTTANIENSENASLRPIHLMLVDHIRFTG